VSYEPLHHKYRPQTFAQLVGQSAIATTLTNAINQTKIAPAYLFTGARGTGKTSSARILAKSLNCLQSDRPTPEPCGICEVCRMIANGQAMDVIEIDAASNTGVDNIRELIERAQFAPVQCRYKVYCLDEVHMLSTAAFNALLKTLEEPPDRVVFILATTDPQRVLPTIISRCQRFDFRRIPLPEMAAHLQEIAQKEAIDITPEAIQLVSQIAQGGLRDAESLLDQLSLLPSQINVAQVWDLVGAVPELDLLGLLQAIAANDPEAVLDQARRLMERGREPLILLQNLTGFYRDLLIAKTAPQRQDLVAITPSTWTQLCQFAQTQELPSILAAQQHLRTCELQVKNSTQPRLWLEVALLGLLPANLQTVNLQGVTSTSPAPARPVALPTPAVAAAPAAPVAAPSQPISSPPAPSAPTPPVFQPPHTAPPPAPEPPPNPPEPEVAEVMDLASLWQRVVQAIQPPGTQALLKQQAWLLAFKGREARVGIKTQPLFKMAQERLPNIEAAFEVVLEHVVRVKLEVAAFPDSKAQPSPPPASTPYPSQPPHPPTAPAPISQAPPSQPNPTPPIGHPPPIPTANDLPPLDAELPPPKNGNGASAAQWQDVDDLTRASRSFAQFFNGVVVDLDSGSVDTTDDAGIAPNQIPAAGSSADETEPPEDDMPF
jgi:DNA polymerase III subunit gamma/tau